MAARKKGGGRGRALGFWALVLVVAALAVSAAMGRFRREPTEDPRVDDGAVATRVEILNGSGRPGVGSHLATALREAGFQVVDVRNADRFDYPRTLVVARSEDVRGAREVARFLDGSQLIRQRSSADFDVTVVIGRDRSGQQP